MGLFNSGWNGSPFETAPRAGSLNRTRKLLGSLFDENEGERGTDAVPGRDGLGATCKWLFSMRQLDSTRSTIRSSVTVINDPHDSIPLLMGL